MEWTCTVLKNKFKFEFHALITKLELNRSFLVNVSSDNIVQLNVSPSWKLVDGVNKPSIEFQEGMETEP